MDSPEVPSIMKWLVETPQAEPVDFSLNAFRCSGPIFMTQEVESADLSYLILRKSRRQVRIVILNHLPHVPSDARQKVLEQKRGTKI